MLNRVLVQPDNTADTLRDRITLSIRSFVRTFFTCTVAASLFCGCTQQPDAPPSEAEPNASAHAALRKAAKFLVNQQSAEDGNWYSEVYGMFNQSNHSVAPTALVVYALAHLPAELRAEHEPTVRAALERLRGQITKQGFVGNADGGAHYPTYVTGMVLAAYHRLGWELPEKDRAAMISYLASAQLSQSRGWRPEDEHFGGWDLLGDQLIERYVDGPGTNVSVTSFALEGLAPAIENVLSSHVDPSLSVVDEAVPVFAVHWLARLQRESTEGGFAFGPDRYSNKAGFEKPAKGGKDKSEKGAESPKLHSYGSATCDGLRSLAYLKIDAGDPRTKSAELWLIRHDAIDTVPGFPSATDKNWQQSLYYYYTMSLAKVYRLYPETGTLTRRGRLADRLVKLQEPNGSWVNSASGMREDDPLIATSFALIALAEAMAEQ